MRIYEPLRGSLGCPARRACQRGLRSEAAEKLSIAAEAWDDVSAAMDRAGAEMGRWLAENTFTRVRVDGVDRWVHVDSVEVATVRHRTSRAGDPHRHVHYQISSRVHAAGRWRAVDGGSALGGRGRAGWSTALNRISERVMYSDPEVLAALAGHGATNRSVAFYCSVGGRGGVR